MRKFFTWAVPIAAASLLAGCAPGIAGRSGNVVHLTSIPATQQMSAADAEKVRDQRMGVIGWSKAPKGIEQTKNNQHRVCAMGGSMNNPIQFKNLSGTSFVATSATGFATFLFTQPGHECPTQLIISNVTRAEAETLASAFTTLANAERSGTRQTSAEPDRDMWNKIANSNDPADFQSFLMTFPSSSFGDQAFARLFSTRQAVAKARAGKKTATAPLLPPPTGLVLSTGPNTTKMSGSTVTSTSKIRIVSGDADNFVEENTTGSGAQGVGTTSHTDSTANYRGRYALFARPGKTTTTSTTQITTRNGNMASRSQMETLIESATGDMNSLFPLKVGNFATTKHVTVMSVTSTPTAGILMSTGPSSYTSRVNGEEACLVDDYKPIKTSSGTFDTFKIFCASKHIADINGGKSPSYTFIDYYYSPKIRYNIKAVSSSTHMAEGQEHEYTIISGAN